MTEIVLVTTDDQQLKMIDPVTMARDRKREEDYLADQTEYFEHLKEQTFATGADIGDYSDIYGGVAGMPGMEAGMAPGGRRTRNSLRRGNDPMMDMMQGPAGAMPGGGPAGPGGRGRRGGRGR